MVVALQSISDICTSSEHSNYLSVMKRITALFSQSTQYQRVHQHDETSTW